MDILFSGGIPMNEPRLAKLFKNGASQAVRLPADYRFEGEDVYITRDEVTGDVLLSSYPSVKAWDKLFELSHSAADVDGFMLERPLNKPSEDKGLFSDEMNDQSEGK
jgi:antitoxin VapB